eukprot:CAMPEP_0177647698 /NCGR_PEP_ID=MMETSP0447-20121125/10440_1 /TAXON_ID=0 /ORGANISM="Stygamoeba regulata, Strain BSH-02190019" /LENGTH=759 /DNA_ID=CAMNT_0019150303 /DNA_START=198 /DNA_END=2477 /DNA_ORIENTATION=+
MAWSEAEVETLISRYLAVGPEWSAIQKALPGRNKTGIYQKVWKLKKNGAIPDDSLPPLSRSSVAAVSSMVSASSSVPTLATLAAESSSAAAAQCDSPAVPHSAPATFTALPYLASAVITSQQQPGEAAPSSSQSSTTLPAHLSGSGSLSGPTITGKFAPAHALASRTRSLSAMAALSQRDPAAQHSAKSSSKRKRSATTIGDSSSSSSVTMTSKKSSRRSSSKKAAATLGTSTHPGSSSSPAPSPGGKTKLRARRWSEEDLQELFHQFRLHQTNWEEIGKAFPHRNVTSIATKFSKLKSAGKLPPDVHASYVGLTYHRHHWWDKQEIETLIDLLHMHGPGEWDRYFVPALPRRSKNDIITKYRSLAKQGKIPENPKWTPEEERVLFSLAQLHSESGSEWSPAPTPSSACLSKSAVAKSKRAAAKRALQQTAAIAAAAAVSAAEAEEEVAAEEVTAITETKQQAKAKQQANAAAPSPSAETEQQTPGSSSFTALTPALQSSRNASRRRRKANQHMPRRSLQANSPLLANMAPLRVSSLASSAAYSEALSPVMPRSSSLSQPLDQVPQDSPAVFSAVAQLTTQLRRSPSPPHLASAEVRPLHEPMDERTDDHDESVFAARAWSHVDDVQLSRWLLHYGKACYGPQNGVVSWYRELAERLGRTSLEVHSRISHLEFVGAFRFDDHRKLVASDLSGLSNAPIPMTGKHAPLSSDDDDDDDDDDADERSLLKCSRNPIATLTNARAMFAAAAAAATEADAWETC